MTPRQLRRAAAKTPMRARIVSDGCRDYLVEVVSNSGAGLLRHRRGSVLKFRSLAEAHQVLSRCGIDAAVMRQRVADDETCSTICAAAGGSRFHDLPIAIGY